MRPGWGQRHPEVEALVAAYVPAAQTQYTWMNGTLPLAVSAYTTTSVAVPDDLVTSIRCIVVVSDQLVVCRTPDGKHPWPGGRRTRGESFAQTAAREVHEETGWWLDPDSFQPLGWLHLHHLRPVPEDYPWPHPDFFQLVGWGGADRRDGEVDAPWADSEGWELSSELLSPAQAIQAVSSDPLAPVFLRMLPLHAVRPT